MRTVRPVGEADRAAALEVCARDPLSNCYVAARMDEVDLRCADALFPQGQQDEFLCFPRDFCDFPFGDIHMCTSVTLMVVCASLYMQLL